METPKGNHERLLIESTSQIHLRSHKFIRHAYEEVLSSAARLSSFATSRQMRTLGPIDDRQLELALDDLALFGLHCRRLVEHVGVKRRFRSVEIPPIKPGAVSQEPIKFLSMLSVIIHMEDIEILRNKFQMRLLSGKGADIVFMSDYFYEYDDFFDPIIAVKSDITNFNIFRLIDFIEVFQLKILNPIIETCAENSLFLDNDLE